LERAFFVSGDTMNVMINGKMETIAQKLSIMDLCESKKLPVESTIILVNGEIIKKTLWETHKIDERQIIEILRFVGGG
jgi:sulfur carrier protein